MDAKVSDLPEPQPARVPAITPQHILGGIGFEARSVVAAVDAHAAGAPINVEALQAAIDRMAGLASLLRTDAPQQAVPSAAPAPRKRARGKQPYTV